MNMQPTNRDLIWKIGDFSYPEAVVKFLRRFESTFCIFSATVRQLYSNYEMQHPYIGSRSVVVLPNPYAHHDNFYDIPEEAILPTGMFISPGEVQGKEDWLLCYRNPDSKKWKGLNVVKGLEKFKYKYGEDDPFLPVLLNSDLRKSSSSERPLMHLHRVSIKKLMELSDLQRHDISKTIVDKLGAFAA